MPGFIPHFIAGNAMFLIGSVFIQKFSKLQYNSTNVILLYVVCIFSSILPDFVLSIYYIFNIGSYADLVIIHAQFHQIVSPIAAVVFVILAGLDIIKKKAIWIMAPICIILHIIMDATISESSVYF